MSSEQGVDSNASTPDDVSDPRPRLRVGQVMACSVLAFALTFIVIVRPAIRPYTLNLEDPICLNMIGMGSYSRTGDADRSWSYITDDPIPEEWIGQRIDGTLMSWNSGARFSADGVTLRYGNTSKWGPCLAPPIN